MKVNEKFPEFLESLKEIGRDPKTIDEHKRMLYGAIAHSNVFEKEIEDLKLSDIPNIIQSGMTHGEHGGQRAVLTYRMYLQWLEDNKIAIPFNISRIKLPVVHYNEKRALSKEEALKILETFPINDPSTPKRKVARTMKTVCEVLLGSMMRISECLSLKKEQWWDIKQRGEAIIVGKGGDERTVYFTKRAIASLEQYLEQREDRNKAMFVNSYGDKMTTNLFRKNLLLFKKQFPEQMQKDLSSHIFRRSRTTWLLDEGINLKEAQCLGGWKSERTILRHYWKASREKAKVKFQELTKDF